MKKQEEAVGANEEEETVEQCMARVKEENPEMTDEAARAQCTKEPPAETEKGFMTRMMAVFDEAMEKRMTTFWKEVEKRMDEAVKKVQDQAVMGLRKGLGVSEDPVIHLSELPDLVRKTVLEVSEHGKRTETLTKDKPIEGATDEPKKLLSAEESFQKMLKKKTVF